MSTYVTDASDLATLRSLAKRVREIAHSEQNLCRKERWLRHNALQGGEPMVLIEVGGLGQNHENPVTPMLQCKEEWARGLEMGFRSAIYAFEVVKDDWVVEPYLNCNWQVNLGWYGVSAKTTHGGHDGVMGSRVWEPPLQNLQEDFAKLKPRQFSVDRESTLAWKRHMENTLGDILPVRMRGAYWWTMGMTWTAIDLIGLEQLMLYMVDDPEGLHRLMQFLHDDHAALAAWLEKEGLLTLNNENDYIGSGSVAYTNELPKPGTGGHARVRAQDMWVLSESQETVGVGPDMFGEFIYPYQKSIAERFGMCYYGCCEPVHSRWHIVKGISNLRKVSVSPWCDQAFMARELAGKYVFCRKPNPSLISTERFDEDAIRADLRQTVDLCRTHGTNLEIIMKDVHTVQRKPERLARWVELAREACRA